MTRLKIFAMSAAIAALGTATPALAGGDMKVQKTTSTTTTMSAPVFADYDGNSDGRVDFSEYAKWAKKDGLTTTAAAQRFTKMTQGQAYFDEGTFISAMSNDPSWYDTTLYSNNSRVVTTGNTEVLGATNVMAPATTTTLSTTTRTIDAETYLEPNTDATVTTSTTVTGSMQAATTEPILRQDGDVMGDLNQTANPTMKVRPETTLETPVMTETDVDIDLDGTDVDIETETDFE